MSIPCGMEVVMAFTGDEDEAIIFTNVACVNRVIYDGGGGGTWLNRRMCEWRCVGSVSRARPA